jgi:geranylgeranyl reductase family protein
VLLLDRAKFPRDKPCGGGLTIRAVRQLPFSIDPVVEDVVDRIELRLRYGRQFERPSPKPLVLMTQRRRLDAFLAEQAAAAGAEFRDGVRVAAVALDGSVAVELEDGERVRGDTLVGADGANGVTARALGLCAGPAYGVALEGNLPNHEIDAARYRGRAVFELGNIEGGYGWIFPKGDHVNVGVGGWEPAGPRLREHLGRLCQEHGFREGRLREVRGHRLPVARSGAAIASGRALLVGDAAGLVDPFSGDGLYEAFLSAALAANAVLDLLAGRASGLEPYEARVKRALARHLFVSWTAKLALERYPRLMFNLARSDFVQGALQRLARGDAAPMRVRPLSELSLRGLDLLARRAGAGFIEPRASAI